MSTKAEILLTAQDRSAAAFAAVSRHFDGLQSKATALKGGLAGVGSTLGGALVVTYGRSMIDMLDGLDDMSEKTGITVEKLSELRYAGEVAGTPIEALSSGFGRLAKLMGEAAGGNKEAISTFKTLGVEYKNADGTLRNTDEVLGDLADRFATYEDGAGKAALAQKVFGKSGAEMIPLLNLGRKGIADLRNEAEQLGAIYGGDLAKEAANFNDNLKRLELASQAASVSIGGPLLKSLNNLLNQYIEIKKIGSVGLVVKDLALGFLDPNFSKMSLDAGADVKRLMAERDKVQKEIDGAAAQNVGGPAYVELANQARKKQLAELNQYLEVAKVRQRVDALSSVDPADANDAVSRRFQRESGKTQAPSIPSGGGAKAKDAEAAVQRYLESLDKQLEKTKELSQVEMALTEIQRIRAEGGNVSEAQKQRILRTAAEVDIIKERADTAKVAKKDEEEQNRRIIEQQNEARRVIDATLTPLESYNEKLEKLIKLRNDGFLSAEQFTRAMGVEANAYGEAQAKLDESTKKLDEFAKRGAENIQDYLGDGLYDVLDGNFDNIEKSFGNMLKRMVAEAGAAQLSRLMFGDMVQGGSGSGLFGTALQGLGLALGFGSTGYSAADQAGLDGLISGVAKLDTGTNYVPQDMLAVIHEGEAVVPKAYNHGDVGSPAGLSLHYAPVFQVDGTADRAAAMVQMERISAESQKRLIADLQRRKVIP